MKIYKFGGTSLGSPKRMHNVVEIIASDALSKVVVLSAIKGTTDLLYKVAAHHKNNISVLVKSADRKQALNALHNRLFFGGNRYEMSKN